MEYFFVILTALSATFVSIAAMVAVISRQFDDTFIQRVGLSGLSICSASVAWWVFQTNYLPDAWTGYSIFSAIYAGGCFYKNRGKILKKHTATQNEKQS